MLTMPIKGWDVIFFYFLDEKLPARVATVPAVTGSQLLFRTLVPLAFSTFIKPFDNTVIILTVQVAIKFDSWFFKHIISVNGTGNVSNRNACLGILVG